MDNINMKVMDEKQFLLPKRNKTLILTPRKMAHAKKRKAIYFVAVMILTEAA